MLYFSLSKFYLVLSWWLHTCFGLFPHNRWLYCGQLILNATQNTTQLCTVQQTKFLLLFRYVLKVCVILSHRLSLIRLTISVCNLLHNTLWLILSAVRKWSIIQRNEEEISPSVMFAVASILEGSSYINGSPQNTFLPGVLEMARTHNVLIGGDDFKSGTI